MDADAALRDYVESLRRDGLISRQFDSAEAAGEWRAAMRRACRAEDLRIRTVMGPAVHGEDGRAKLVVYVHQRDHVVTDAKQRTAAKEPHSEKDKRRLSRRLRSAPAVITTALALAFAYLAVAVSAHWFPWHQPPPKPRPPSMTAVFIRGARSDSIWNRRVYKLVNFLSGEYTRVVKLDLSFNSKGNYNIFSPKPLNTRTQFLRIKLDKSIVKDVVIAAVARHDAGQILDLEILHGPASALGYITTSAVQLDISGYFQIGTSPIEGAGYITFNLIPVQPPS